MLAAAGCVAFVLLGNWQSQRADEKRAAAADDKRVVVTGQFVERHTGLLDNRLRHGRAGYEVVTPLRLAGGVRHVLVARGWIAAGPSPDVAPPVRTPAGEQRIEGRVLAHLPRALEGPAAPAGGRVRPNLAIGAFAAETGLALESYAIEQHSSIDDGLARDWPVVAFGPEKHEAYAFQWYGLAALSVVLFAVLSFRRVA